MILHWQELARYYGNCIEQHRERFEAAHQSTYVMLCNNFSSPGEQICASGSHHAEAKLLETPEWQSTVPANLNAWHSGDDTINITFVLNRSPCSLPLSTNPNRPSTDLLVDTIMDLKKRFPEKMEQANFILAARAAYEDAELISRTTHRSLMKLYQAGWQLAVLQTGDGLSSRGRLLLQSVEQITGQRGQLRYH